MLPGALPGQSVPTSGSVALRACLLTANAPAEEPKRSIRRTRSRLHGGIPSGSAVPHEEEEDRSAKPAPLSDKGVDSDLTSSLLVGYRSVGLGLWGAVLRYAGMPLEKFALFMNSSQVSGSGQLGQAMRLTFAEGPLGPFKVVGRASLIAWFFQYSAMGLVFQGVDIFLSSALGVGRVQYGAQLMKPVDPKEPRKTADEVARTVVKTASAPIIAGTIESCIANRAEVQRYFGLNKFAELPQASTAMARAAGPAFAANAARNAVMSSTSFVLTPLTYKHFFPQERKSQTTLFWYGLGMNIFVGNVIAINLQALWGRSLDHLAANGSIDYRATIRDGLKREGISAFITPSKWFSRVLMNAPAQGTLPWFYNEVLPLGEGPVRRFAGAIGAS